MNTNPRRGISSDDPQAIPKLEEKLAKAVALQEKMKAVNLYYRKHKTLDGCTELTLEQAEKLEETMGQSPICTNLSKIEQAAAWFLSAFQ